MATPGPSTGLHGTGQQFETKNEVEKQSQSTESTIETVSESNNVSTKKPASEDQAQDAAASQQNKPVEENNGNEQKNPPMLGEISTSEQSDRYSCQPLEETHAQPQVCELNTVNPLSIVNGRSEWKCEPHSPFPFESYFVSSTVYDEDLYTVSSKHSHLLYKFDRQHKNWIPLKFTAEDQEITSFAITTFKGCLFSVGGILSTGNGDVVSAVRKLEKLEGNDSFGWSNSKEMPTRRYYPSVTSSDEYLVVCGGLGKNKNRLNCVEIYNGQKWDTVCGLPFTGGQMNAVLDYDRLYVSNAYEDWKSPSHNEGAARVVYASIEKLLNKDNKPCTCEGKPSQSNETRDDLITKRCWQNVTIAKSIFGGESVDRPSLILFKFDPYVLAISGDVLYVFFSCEKKFVIMEYLDMQNDVVYGASVNVLDSDKIILIGGKSSKESDPSDEVKQLVFVDRPPLQPQ